MKNPFTHLHVHSEFSSYDGISRIPELTKKASEFGMKHLSLTDHGTLGGAIKFYESCRKNSINPIIGIEGYICEDITNKSSKDHHLIVLAKNYEGYRNLLRLSSFANENFGGHSRFKKPRFDLETLGKYSNGLIVSSACILGEVAKAIVSDGDGKEKAQNIVKKYKDVLGDDYYLEIMYQGSMINDQYISEDTRRLMKNQKYVMDCLKDISKHTGVKMIITNDVHYVCPNDFTARYMKMKINTISKTKQNGVDEDGESSDSEFNANDTLDYYLKSGEEMWNFWGDYFPEELTRTYEIGEQCDIRIPLLSLGDKVSIRLPNIEIPKDDDFISYLSSSSSIEPEEVKYVRYLSVKGLRQRGLMDKPEYINRLKYELSVLSCNPIFCKDFLMILDSIQYAKEVGILTGPGRGSGAGCLILYLIGITQVDPIFHDLDFDRFLSADEIIRLRVEDYTD